VIAMIRAPDASNILSGAVIVLLILAAVLVTP